MLSPLLQPSPPAAPTEAGFCRVYGRVCTPDGRSIAFQEIRFVLFPADTAPTFSGANVVMEPARAVTNRSGTFQIDLPQGFTFMLEGIFAEPAPIFTIPTLEVVKLTDILWPYPVALRWYTMAEEDAATYTLLPAEDPEVNAAEGENVYLGLGALYSDGSLIRLSSPQVAATPSTALESSGRLGVAITLSSAGTVTVSSLEVERAPSSEGSLWERVGYSVPSGPVFAPASQYELTDPQDVLVNFAP